MNFPVSIFNLFLKCDMKFRITVQFISAAAQGVTSVLYSHSHVFQ